MEGRRIRRLNCINHMETVYHAIYTSNFNIDDVSAV